MYRLIEQSSAETFARWFRALADPTRLQIARVLAEHRGALSVGGIVERVDVGQSTVSHHLKILSEVAFVQVEHRGTTSFYRINKDCVECLPSAADVLTGTSVASVPSPADGVVSTTEEPAVQGTIGLVTGDAVRAAEPGSGETLLVLGASNGWEIVLAARRVGANGRVIGLGSTQEAIRQARRVAAGAGVANAEFMVGPIDQIPLRDESVDVVLSDHVISLARHKVSVVAEVARVLRLGGRIGFVDVATTLGGGDEYAAMLATAGIRQIELQPVHDGHQKLRALVVRGVTKESRGPTYALMHPTHGAGVLAVHRAIINVGKGDLETEYSDWADWNDAHLDEHRFVALHPVTGQVVGWAALSPVSCRPVYAGVARVSVYVDPVWQGRGIASGLLEVAVAASETGGIWTLQAEILPENTPSFRVLEKAGFRLVGVRELMGRSNGRWHDIALYERRSKIVDRLTLTDPESLGGGQRLRDRAEHHGQPLQRVGFHPVVDPSSATLRSDQPRLAQHLQVMGDGGPGQPERRGQIAHARLAVPVAGDQ